MTWSLVFIAVAAVSALFGFGVLASAEVAQVLSVLFFLLGLGALAAKVLDEDSSRRDDGTRK
ncbi:hypothetical protein SAMN05444004_12422 [Jannaschia faecimaris]|uniref:Uncharacterized protein n=1 Tax=Jannaschia faecimaris TaxID=1244108 RepID=A0A1H3U5P5_9RHOB|nr:hypothetical protein [Jannaschia faecimaris]SDZ57793.1 hypothetical protein SAMN05444004_12422 [Jannaschia faecimaris]